MARSVTISTPIPTLEELGNSLGLSKSRQNSLLRLVDRRAKNGPSGSERLQRTSAAKHGQSSDLRVKKK